MYSVGPHSPSMYNMLQASIYSGSTKKNTVNLVKCWEKIIHLETIMHPGKPKNCLQSYCFPGKESGSQNKQGTQHELPLQWDQQSHTSASNGELKQKCHLTWVETVDTLLQLICTTTVGWFTPPNEQLTQEGSNTNTAGAWRQYGNTDLTFKNWRKQSENGEDSSVFSELSEEGGRWEAEVPWEHPLHFWAIRENVLLTLARGDSLFPLLQQLTHRICN